MKAITYIFIQGRKDKFLNKNVDAKEFYYGLDFLAKNNNIQVLEFSDSSNLFSTPLKIIDKLFNKILSIPSYSHKLVSISNLKILLKSDKVILVSESTGFSSLLMLVFLKFRKTQVSLFVMGLYSKKLRFPQLIGIHNLLIKILVFFIDDILILGKGEYKKALEFHRSSSKIHYFPFCVDTKFWNAGESKDITKNTEILFVGNDGNRDYQLLINLAKSMENYKFRFISENIHLSKIELSNVILEMGKWGSSYITDYDLKEFYKKSKLVIVPLKESTQPSGQSVSLQAMSLGIPVIISDTKGFWDKNKFTHKENIYFVQPNSEDNWIKSVEHLFNNSELLEKLSNQGKEIVVNEFSLDSFNNQLTDILKI